MGGKHLVTKPSPAQPCKQKAGSDDSSNEQEEFSEEQRMRARNGGAEVKATEPDDDHCIPYGADGKEDPPPAENTFDDFA